MSDRKPANVADGLVVCWVFIVTVWCLMTGRMDVWVIGSGVCVASYAVAELVRRHKGKQ